MAAIIAQLTVANRRRRHRRQTAVLSTEHWTGLYWTVAGQLCQVSLHTRALQPTRLPAGPAQPIHAGKAEPVSAGRTAVLQERARAEVAAAAREEEVTILLSTADLYSGQTLTFGHFSDFLPIPYVQ